MSDFLERLDDDILFEDLKTQYTRLAKKHAKAETRKIELEKVIQEAARVSFTNMPRPKAPSTGKDRRRKGEEVGVTMVADWQLGKVTPDYNSDVCEQRIRDLGPKVAELVEIQRQDHPVKHGRLWVLGDIVEGEDIFPGQQYLIDSGLVDQVITNGARVLRDLIWGLLGVYETLHCSMVVGNHGRIGRRGVFHPNTNADRMLYLVVSEYFSDETRVTFDIPTYESGDRGWYTVDEVGEYRCLLVHGDQFRGGGYGGLPYYSFWKKTLSWRDMSVSGEIPAFNDVACGHWHRNAKIPIGTVDLRICGSPESYNTYAQETLATTSEPSQYQMFVHPELGRVTSEYRVWLP